MSAYEHKSGCQLRISNGEFGDTSGHRWSWPQPLAAVARLPVTIHESRCILSDHKKTQRTAPRRFDSSNANLSSCQTSGKSHTGGIKSLSKAFNPNLPSRKTPKKSSFLWTTTEVFASSRREVKMEIQCIAYYLAFKIELCLVLQALSLANSRGAFLFDVAVHILETDERIIYFHLKDKTTKNRQFYICVQSRTQWLTSDF